MVVLLIINDFLFYFPMDLLHLLKQELQTANLRHSLDSNFTPDLDSSFLTSHLTLSLLSFSSLLQSVLMVISGSPFGLGLNFAHFGESCVFWNWVFCCYLPVVYVRLLHALVNMN